MANPIEFDLEGDTLIFEDIPKAAPRPPGKGRDPVAWETHMALLKEHQGKSVRLWTYDEKGAAVSRMAGVRKRLTEATPADNWDMKVRPVPDTDPQKFGVYVVYNGIYSAEQVKENAALHEKRSVDAKARAAARLSSNGAEPQQETAAPAPETAKSAAAAKVAAARTAKGKS